MLTGTLPRLCGSFRLRLASTFNHRPDSPAALIIPPFQSVGNMFFLQKNNICVVFFRMSRRFRSKRKFILCFLRNYFEFAGSAPYAHKCGAPCFELYFRKDAFSSFSVLFPICRILQKLHPQACKTRKLFGSGLPEVLSLSAKHSDYKSAKIGCQALRRIKFRQFYENTLKNLRIRGKLWNTDKTNAVFKPVARFSAGRIRPMQCRYAVRCAA